MSEFKKFRDGILLPVNYAAEYEKHQEKLRRQATNKIETQDEYREEKYIVDTVTCTGPQHSPSCFYDFTNKIRQVDHIVFKP